jgi:dynein heavy chain
MICYFYRVILNVCSEARVWERLKYEVPTVVQPVYNKWDKFKFVYERILTVMMDYNQVIEGKINLNTCYMYVHACTYI